jgi:hypothetical protein
MKNFRNQRPQGVNVNVNQEDKENAGGKENRLQEI